MRSPGLISQGRSAGADVAGPAPGAPEISPGVLGPVPVIPRPDPGALGQSWRVSWPTPETFGPSEIISLIASELDVFAATPTVPRSARSCELRIGSLSIYGTRYATDGYATTLSGTTNLSFDRLGLDPRCGPRGYGFGLSVPTKRPHEDASHCPPGSKMSPLDRGGVLVGALSQHGFSGLQLVINDLIEAKNKAGGVPAKVIKYIQAMDTMCSCLQPWPSELRSEFVKFLPSLSSAKESKALKLKDKLFGAIRVHSETFEVKTVKVRFENKGVSVFLNLGSKSRMAVRRRSCVPLLEFTL
jgi:hypothetical protein